MQSVAGKVSSYKTRYSVARAPNGTEKLLPCHRLTPRKYYHHYYYYYYYYIYVFLRPQRLRKRLRFYYLGHLWNMP